MINDIDKQADRLLLVQRRHTASSDTSVQPCCLLTKQGCRSNYMVPFSKLDAAVLRAADFCARCTTWDFGPTLEQAMKRQAGATWTRWTDVQQDQGCWRPCTRYAIFSGLIADCTCALCYRLVLLRMCIHPAAVLLQ